MTKTNAKMHSINLINLDLVKAEMRKEHYCNEEDIDNKECIQFIMESCPKYKIQELNNNKVEDVLLYLYYNSQKITSALSKFANDFVKEGQDILKDTSLVQSSILFMVIKNRVYAVPTGQGFRVISKYIIDKFGLIALVSIDSAFKVTALNSNNMSGKTHSENKIFRQELNYFDVQDIDSIIKSLKGKIKNKQTICNLLNIPETSKRNKLGFFAKDSLQLSSSMNLNKLIQTVKVIDDLVPEKFENDFIDIKSLEPNKDSGEINKNNISVYSDIINNIENKEEIYLGYDFFNKEVETFLDYNKYKIVYEDGCKEFDDAYDIFLVLRSLYYELKIDNKTYDEKIGFLSNLKIIGIDEDGIEYPLGNMIENLSGEVINNNKHYLMWYGHYYFVEKNYFERLNKSLEKKLNIVNYDNSLPKWGDVDEDEYNSLLAKSVKGSLIHKCIPDNIEFGDVLQFRDNECYIYHVKDKFNCSMRELDRQVELSMKKLSDLSENLKYFKELYIRSKHQQKRNDENELFKNFKNVDGFIDKMKSVSKFIFKVVLNINDSNSILKSDSNIAKYCFRHILLLQNDYNYEIEICFVGSH